MRQEETRGNLEDSLQEMLLRALSARLGEATIEEGCRLFPLTDRCGDGKCEREGLLNYDVGPADATMSHRTDILLTRTDGRLIAVEVSLLQVANVRHIAVHWAERGRVYAHDCQHQ